MFLVLKVAIPNEVGSMHYNYTPSKKKKEKKSTLTPPPRALSLTAKICLSHLKQILAVRECIGEWGDLTASVKKWKFLNSRHKKPFSDDARWMEFRKVV